MLFVFLLPLFVSEQVDVTCGERGIRTPEALLTLTRFPGVPLQPLEHLSITVLFRLDTPIIVE